MEYVNMKLLSNFFNQASNTIQQTNAAGDTRNVRVQNVTFKKGKEGVGEEKVLYSYTFATSQYNSLWAKLNMGSTHNLAYTGSVSNESEITDYRFNKREPLETYDVMGFSKGGVKQYRGLMEIKDEYKEAYHQDSYTQILI